MSEAQKIKHSLTTTTDDAKTLLEDLAAAIGDGQLTVDAGDERVQMTPHGSVEVGIKVSSKGETESIRIELGWRKPAPPLRVVTESGGFSIGQPMPEGTQDAPQGHEDEDEDDGQASANIEASLTELLSSLSRERLYEMAQERDLSGRSSMDKAELIVALDAEMTIDDLTRDDLAAIASDRIDTPTSDDTRDELLEKVSRC